MHEYSIAYDIYATARRAALENSATSVTAIHVDVGEIAMVNPEQVVYLFKLIIEDDPIFSGTDLVCTTVKPVMTCSCGNYAGENKFVCPSCGGLPQIVKGKEIVVTNIEIEVDES